MKKVFFWIFLLITIVFIVRIGNILLNDLPRLTTYGYGYLTGLAISCTICCTVTIILGMKTFRKKSG